MHVLMEQMHRRRAKNTVAYAMFLICFQSTVQLAPTLRVMPTNTFAKDAESTPTKLADITML